MSLISIKMDHSAAKASIDAQIAKGNDLVEQASRILRETPAYGDLRTRAKDNFEVLYKQWCDFTIEAINQIFVSDTYADEFYEMWSSKRKLVGSDWSPDVGYYLEYLLIPKIDYLHILSDRIDQFQREKSLPPKENTKKRQGSSLEEPEHVTPAWLWEHVPWNYWLTAVSLLGAAFVLGVYIGQFEFVRALISLWK